MTASQRQHADALADGIGLLRTYLAGDHSAAAAVIGALEPGEVLRVLGGLVGISAGLLKDVARMTAETTDQLLDQLVADLQRRST